MHQNHHGFELCATALGSWDSDSAVPLHTRVLRSERRRQNAQLLAVKLGKMRRRKAGFASLPCL